MRVEGVGMRVREVERIGRLEQEGVESYHLQGLETKIWSVPRGETRELKTGEAERRAGW